MVKKKKNVSLSRCGCLNQTKPGDNNPKKPSFLPLDNSGVVFKLECQWAKTPGAPNPSLNAVWKTVKQKPFLWSISVRPVCRGKALFDLEN